MEQKDLMDHLGALARGFAVKFRWYWRSLHDQWGKIELRDRIQIAIAFLTFCLVLVTLRQLKQMENSFELTRMQAKGTLAAVLEFSVDLDSEDLRLTIQHGGHVTANSVSMNVTATRVSLPKKDPIGSSIDFTIPPSHYDHKAPSKKYTSFPDIGARSSKPLFVMSKLSKWNGRVVMKTALAT